MNFQYGVLSWCCVDSLMYYWERKHQALFLKFIITNYSMPARTGYQVLLIFQCVFNMLVCPCTGHVLFFQDKSCLLIGGPHQYPTIWDPWSGCISYMPRPGDPDRETVSNFRVCLHIKDFHMLPGFAGFVVKVTKPRELGSLGSRTQLTQLSWVHYKINKKLSFS